MANLNWFKLILLLVVLIIVAKIIFKTPNVYNVRLLNFDYNINSPFTYKLTYEYHSVIKSFDQLYYRRKEVNDVFNFDIFEEYIRHHMPVQYITTKFVFERIESISINADHQILTVKYLWNSINTSEHQFTFEHLSRLNILNVQNCLKL